MPYEDYFKEASASATLEEKIEIIKQNNKQALNICREIRSWQSSSFPPVKVPSVSSKMDILEKPVKVEIDDETQRIVDKISLLDISNLSKEEILEQIKKIIGPLANEITMSKISLLLYKECIIYNKMLLEATTIEEVEELREALANTKLKMDLLDELEEEQEVEEVLTSTNNHFFFLLSDSGKVIALESLRKSVPREYYAAFKKLLLDLKEGKIKEIKKLRRYDFFQIKDFKIRIVFDKLSNGNYVIIDCFMKKADTGIFYRNSLDNKSSQYQKNREKFLRHYKEEGFRKEHEGYLAEIMSLLDCKLVEEDEENVTRSI